MTATLEAFAAASRIFAESSIHFKANTFLPSAPGIGGLLAFEPVHMTK